MTEGGGDGGGGDAGWDGDFIDAPVAGDPVGGQGERTGFGPSGLGGLVIFLTCGLVVVLLLLFASGVV